MLSRVIAQSGHWFRSFVTSFQKSEQSRLTKAKKKLATEIKKLGADLDEEVCSSASLSKLA